MYVNIHFLIHVYCMHVVFSHSLQEGEPEVDDNASITNDQGRPVRRFSSEGGGGVQLFD